MLRVSVSVCSEEQLLKDSFVVMGEDGRASWTERPQSSVKFDVADTSAERHPEVCQCCIET